MNPSKSKLYMLLSNNRFAWIYEFSFTKDDLLTQAGEPHLVS